MKLKTAMCLITCAAVWYGMSLFLCTEVLAIARQSTITIGVSPTSEGDWDLSVMPSAGGEFVRSSNHTISVSTDNFTGYSLFVASNESRSLVSSNNNEIATISSAIDESAFSSSSTYNNKWGYKPSQYITSNGGINSVVSNSNYLPAPSTGGDLMAVTNGANATGTSNTYTMSYGARVNTDLPAGTYEYAFVLTAVANTIVYNVTYAENTNETVSGMPSPNPAALEIAGETPTAQSYGALSNAVPVMTSDDMSFGGWCSVATTVDSVTGNYVCSGTTYRAGDDYPIDQTADGTNITLYAIWLEDPFPMVFSQMDACTFNGATNGNITGVGCEDYWDVKFIDTGVALYSQANYLKDYEIHFTIDHYLPSEQVNQSGDNSQQTFVSDKLGSNAPGGQAPGIIVRRNGNTNIDINSRMNDTPGDGNLAINYVGITDVSVFRIDHKIYYSVNNGPLVLMQDITGFSEQFPLTTTFGAYPGNDCTGDGDPVCTYKRIPQATLSNMYIRLGEMSTDDIHDITFNANGGAPSTTAYKIIDGNTLGTLPTVTKEGWLFDGWWTALDGGQQISAATVPDATTTYWAHWKFSVTDAQITNTDVHLSVSDTETITISNASDLEPYTLVSGNTSVATVNQSTGVITAVGNGTTTITMTGTMSGDTRTISVTVGTLINVDFDSQGGTPSTYTQQVADGGSFSSLPTPTRSGYSLEGWYTGTGGNGSKLTTSTVFNSNTPTQYYANWVEALYVCKIAKPNKLHTETCSQTGSNGCRGAGYTTSGDTSIITYGTIPSSSTKTAGDAYDCDVNNDGDYDDETERFYYFGTENGNDKFVYYQSIVNTDQQYTPALGYLPTSSDPDWDNPNLVTFTGDYAGKVARFMTYPEAHELCGDSDADLGVNGKCLYLLEKSNFANTNLRDGIWLEKQTGYNNRIQTKTRVITHGSTTANSVRPTIEVSSQYVEPYTPPVVIYEITFNPHNGDNNTTVTINAGDAIGANMPTDPTYTDHLFQGWFTAVSGGTQVTSATEPDGNWTYHAQWKGTVALAEFANSTIRVTEGTTDTISVTNASDIEAYTFSSNNTSIATVDSQTGVVTGVGEGSTTITLTGTTSGATKTIDVIVADLLPVTQAVISNDLILAVGDTITVVVSNSAQLEPYTFSSQDATIASVNANTGAITGESVGTTNIIMTGTQTGLTKTLEVDVDAAPITKYTVTFDANGGSTPTPFSSVQVDDGDAVGSLPTTSRTNYRFFGWYKDDGTFYEEVYEDEIIDNDVTYYARWVEDTASFPIVFSEINACTFGGDGVNVSGDYCTQPKNKSYVDSGISLYTTANYGSDYEIGFTLIDYDFDSVNQMTLVAAKKENSTEKWPGLAVRRKDSTDNMEFTHSMNVGSKVTHSNIDAATINRVKVVRESGVIKYSVNDGSLITLQDTNNMTAQYFDHTVWFGASAKENKTPQRGFIGTLTDMYVKLGAPTDYIIDFDANGGSFTNSSDSSKTITINDPLGTLPVPNPPTENHTFVGWFDESTSPATQVTTSTVPDSNKTYVAHYSYASSNTPIEFDVSNNATRGYQTLINSWVGSPVGITSFNEASPINNSTWGDTSELSELQFWTAVRNNFVSNECLIWSAGGNKNSDAVKPLSTLSAWTSGSVDCSKPDAYNTGLNAALNVYLNDANGAQVAYAKADNGVIHNMIPGQTYYWEQANDSTVYGYVTAKSNGSNTGTRWVDTDVVRNARDLGGLPVSYTDSNNQTVTGTLAYGRLFRGEKMSNVDKSEFTNLGITTEYNVGDEYSSDTHLDDYHYSQVIHYNFDYHSGDENNASSNYMKAWTAVTNIMTDIANTNTTKNVFFHCRVGADRTGTVAYLLEGLLGVPDEARYQEYELTNVSGLYDRTRYYKQKDSGNANKFVFMMGYVKTTQDIYDWYMSNPNASDALIQAFRTAMTVPTNQQQRGAQNSPQRNLRNTGGENDGESENADSEVGSSYEDPLGVIKTTESSIVSSEPSHTGEIVAVVSVVAVVGAAVGVAAARKQQE